MICRRVMPPKTQVQVEVYRLLTMGISTNNHGFHNYQITFWTSSCLWFVVQGLLRVIPTHWRSIWHIFWHSTWHSVWHFVWYIFWHSIWHSIWHMFGPMRAQLHPELAIGFGSMRAQAEEIAMSFWHLLLVHWCPQSRRAGRRRRLREGGGEGERRRRRRRRRRKKKRKRKRKELHLC